MMVNRGHLNVLEAISVAGGTMLEAATDSIQVLHRTDSELIQSKIKLASMTDGKVAPPVLVDNDVVYVPPSKAKSLFVNGAVIIGATASSLVYRIP
jgi:protein involved in polysaccharide export with SLBB domain